MVLRSRCVYRDKHIPLSKCENRLRFIWILTRLDRFGRSRGSFIEGKAISTCEASLYWQESEFTSQEAHSNLEFIRSGPYTLDQQFGTSLQTLYDRQTISANKYPFKHALTSSGTVSTFFIPTWLKTLKRELHTPHKKMKLSQTHLIRKYYKFFTSWMQT